MLFDGRYYINDTCFSEVAVKFSHLLVLEFNYACSQRIQSGIAALAYVLARVVFGAVLADNYVAFFNGLVAEYFYA